MMPEHLKTVKNVTDRLSILMEMAYFSPQTLKRVDFVNNSNRYILKVASREHSRMMKTEHSSTLSK